MTKAMTEAETGRMPRGGPGAPWWDRMYETDRPEFIDRTDRPDAAARVLRGLDRFQRITLAYRACSRLTLAEVPGVERPRILELGAGRGRLARQLLADRPGARLTVSDVSEASVEALRAGPLGADPRVETRVLDATRIDAPDGHWDVAVFAFALHHLTPEQVVSAMTEGTRAARRLLLIDGWRNPVFLLGALPLWLGTGGLPHVHDGVITIRKVYGARAVEALAARCPHPVTVRCRFHPPAYLVASLKRASP